MSHLKTIFALDIFSVPKYIQLDGIMVQKVSIEVNYGTTIVGSSSFQALLNH